MQMPKMDEDFWELVAAEDRISFSKEFSIPAKKDLESLKLGLAVQLIFKIELEDEVGIIHYQSERMWVVVSEICFPFYIGRLINTPASITEVGDFYLRYDAEIPFQSRHVIDIDRTPETILAVMFASTPTASWSRTAA